MIKDLNYLKRFRYLADEKYKKLWVTNNFGTYSKTQTKRIKNYWETFEHYGFDKTLLSK